MEFEKNKIIDKNNESETKKTDLCQNEEQMSDPSEIDKHSNSVDSDKDLSLKQEHELKSDNEKNEENLNKETHRAPSRLIKQFKDMYSECSRENIHLHQTVTFLQEKQHIMSLKVIGANILIIF